jgi:DNA-binding NarL/FixJ family response regulator
MAANRRGHDSCGAPCSFADEASDEARVRRSARVSRVVIVDDDEEMRVLVAAMLRGRLGAEVVGEGANGNEAVELCGALRPDVLVLDHVMPERYGGDAVLEIRQASPETCIVMFSATVLHAVDLGESDHLPDRFVCKSDGLGGLRLAVQGCIDEHQPLPGT